MRNACVLACVLAGCGGRTLDDDGDGSGGDATADGEGDDGGDGGPTGGDDGSGTGGDDGDAGDDGDDGGGGGCSSGRSKFDIGCPPDLPPPDPNQGCEKVDLLFVIDDSTTMELEQQTLLNAFPLFFDALRNTINAQDFHIMVTGTAPEGSDQDCGMTLGVGRTQDGAGMDCGIDGGLRYMVEGQANVGSTFACLSQVGTSGSGTSRSLESLVAATGSLTQPGQCNEGFVRDDALLVVMVVSDHEDDSPLDPGDWVQALIANKSGDGQAVVVLGLVEDAASCFPSGDPEDSPRLREFISSFTYGTWGPICEPGYDGIFVGFTELIDVACDNYLPPG